MEKAGSPSTVPSSVPWSVPVAVDDIPAHGFHIEIEAPAAIRTQILQIVAGLASVRDLPRLSAVFDLTWRGARIHVVGHVTARVGQVCVVTLEPIESDVNEAVDLLFAPTSAEGVPAEREIEIKLDKEPPEPLAGGTVDLGALATEFLVLGIDPYPRKAGAEFSPLKVGDDGPRHFAALEALKKRFGGSQS
ncbi:MAG: DUF177 domain-containing protein [Pseudolabrys sp.]|nr:DUF177 domain-containing protein [Pseudolabrys sp.]